ncbi:protein kinase domain-containing protein [Streptomyces wedmorensis]
MTDAWQPGATVLEEFSVERILGAGGFGSVALLRALRSGERYAAKRLHETGTVHQGRLIGEARRWMALPPHPYITGCRFTRTVRERLVVFSDYVPGGSLADRIRSGALYGDGGRPALRRALTAAAQIAYGLDAAHSAGLLHLDVKPGNILFDDVGAAKVTDFGLAVALRSTTGADAPVPPEAERALWTVIRAPGHTQAYASPEQAEGRAVGPAADVWSWAVTLLEMLVGERTWPSGAVAALVLDSARHEPLTGRSLMIPPSLAELLARCFHEDPRARPDSLRPLAAALLDIAEGETGTPLPVVVPAVEPTSDARERVHERRSTVGFEREDPWELLSAAYAAARIGETDRTGFRQQPTGGRKAQLLEELEVLDEAWRVLTHLPDATGPHLLLRVRCALSMADVQEALGDLGDAVERYRTCVRLLDLLPPEESFRWLSPALNNLAILLRRQGAVEESLRVADRAIATARRTVDAYPTSPALGNALLTKANTLQGKDGTEARYTAAASAMRVAGNDVGEAKVLANLAGFLARQGSTEQAHRLWDEADQVLARHEDPARHDVQAARAALWLQRASEAEAGTDAELRCARKAVDLYAPLVRDHGIHEYSGDLGRALFRVGRVAEHRGSPQVALSAYGLASEALASAVLRDGRPEFTEDLARSYDHESRFTADLEDPERAVAMARRAVDMWRRVADMDGLGPTGGSLVEALRRLAEALQDAGHMLEAETAIEEAVRVTTDPGFRRDRTGRLIEAGLYRAWGVWHRRRGRHDEAWRECTRALDLLEGQEGEEAAHFRILAMETLSGVCLDTGRYRQAVVMCQDVVAAMLAQAKAGFLRQADLADGIHRLAQARAEYGNAGDAAVAARLALENYDGLVTEGRVDLAADAARTRMLLGVCLLREGELDSAADELESALRCYESLSDRDVDRIMPPGGPRRTAQIESIEYLLAETREVLAIGPDQLERELDRRRAVQAAAHELFQVGSPREASQLLEHSAGMLHRLALVHPGDAVEQVLAETALLLGICAGSCSRGGAARHAFRRAVASFRRLATDLGRPEFAPRCFDACIVWASALGWEGDEPGVRAVLQEMRRQVDHIRPAEAETWERRAEESMAEVRESRERAAA